MAWLSIFGDIRLGRCLDWGCAVFWVAAAVVMWRASRADVPFPLLWRHASAVLFSWSWVCWATIAQTPAWRHAAQLVFGAVALFGSRELFMHRKRLREFPKPMEAGAVCDQALDLLDEVVAGRRARGGLTDEDEKAAARTARTLAEMATRMRSSADPPVETQAPK